MPTSNPQKRQNKGEGITKYRDNPKCWLTDDSGRAWENL